MFYRKFIFGDTAVYYVETPVEGHEGKTVIGLAAYPAAGEPSVGAEKFVRGMEEYCRKGLVNIVGGCCGTTPEYISLLSRMAAKHAPRVFAPER